MGALAETEEQVSDPEIGDTLTPLGDFPGTPYRSVLKKAIAYQDWTANDAESLV